MAKSNTQGIRRPSAEELRSVAEYYNVTLNNSELEDYDELVDALLDSIDIVDDYPEPRFDVHEREYTDRSASYRPTEDEDPYNAWILKCRVEGSDDGPLAGMEVGLKDSIALAGYELTCGSSLLEGYVPQIDATVATRLLEAGATITGKLNMESFAWSGSSDTSDFGTVPTPHDDDHLAGGSSSGSGAAPAAGDCDIAIGTDQGGSVRVPSAWCGLVGLKPTTGLVPYTGIVSIDRGYDHPGPQTRTVETNAAALQAIAGVDVQDGLRMDPRQPRNIETGNYVDAVEGGVADLEIGVLEEGFDWDVSDEEVDEAVYDSVEVLEELGATADPVSVELHRLAVPLWTAAAVQGGADLIEGETVGSSYKGWYWSDMAETFGKFRQARANAFPPTVKSSLLTNGHLQNERNIELYAKAKNIALDAERQYNRILEDYDALVLPTTPMLPYERNEDLSRVERVGRTLTNLSNTAMFDLTSHPALTVPCAKSDGLPIGLMVVGSHFDEEMLYRIAGAFENETDWENR